ncbi:DUF4244 domain-containing protein [Nesterenkonia massiliensis]|uniref:DUF4244 domain-containing protein n=2 Tax=Nesterenkonia TaxID=57494 RepID=A0ABP9FW09_9MICC|nr:DUF4244 domain-containing protein [Nesterenkonia massiliensis]MCT1606896.1 DUF4244 domain-containing protein [Nesterenkonia massiliensis]
MSKTTWPKPLDSAEGRAALRRLEQDEDGLATAEYGIVMLAAVAFAGLLTAVLTSDTVQGLLESVVQRALSH